MKISPADGFVLCRRLEELADEKNETGIFFERESFPVYEVIDAAGAFDPALAPGDRVVCCSTGTELKTGGEVQYLFSGENIIGKVN